MEQEAPDLVPLQRHCLWSKSLHENSRKQLGCSKARTTLLKQVRKAILFQLRQLLLTTNVADIWEEKPNLQVSLGKKDNNRIYIQYLFFSWNCLRDWSGVLLRNQHILDAQELLRTQKSSVACWSIRGPSPLRQKLEQLVIKRMCPTHGFFLSRERLEWNVHPTCQLFKGLPKSLVSVSCDLEH